MSQIWVISYLISTHAFLIAYLFQSVIVSWYQKSDKIGKENVKISQEKKANKSNTKQKNIIFDRVSSYASEEEIVM